MWDHPKNQTSLVRKEGWSLGRGSLTWNCEGVSSRKVVFKKGLSLISGFMLLTTFMLAVYLDMVGRGEPG